MSTDTILVTGGAGYVGCHVAAELVRQGYDVVVFDDLSTGHRAAVPGGARFVRGSLLDEAAVTDLFAQHRIDGIMHFAALSLVGESMHHPFRYLRENFVGALHLVELAVRHDVGRFILSSTANLFGTPSRVPITEAEAAQPGSPYGESKLFIERTLAWADRIHGLRSACLRYFNAAGAMPDGSLGEDHDPETHLIPIALQAALGQREELVIFGDDYPTPDGTCVRDYIHVLDLAQAHILALGALEKGSCSYNLGNGVGHSVREVIETVRQITGRDFRVTQGPRRKGDPPVLVASSEKIRHDLGWRPDHADLESIVRTAWAWHESHPSGYAGRPGAPRSG